MLKFENINSVDSLKKASLILRKKYFYCAVFQTVLSLKQGDQILAGIKIAKRGGKTL